MSSWSISSLWSAKHHNSNRDKDNMADQNPLFSNPEKAFSHASYASVILLRVPESLSPC